MGKFRLNLQTGIIICLLIAITSAIVTYYFAPQLTKRTAVLNQEKEQPEEQNQVVIEPASLKSLEIEIIPVSLKETTQVITVPAEIEANELSLQQITPLVSGRVEGVYAKLGDYVKKGMVLATIFSSQVAELHGKLHEAETRLALTRQNLDRVRQTASKAAIFKALSDLELAQANLDRIQILFSKGISPEKDLIAAKAEYKRAEAEYNLQKNVAYNRELASAIADVKTAEVETKHIRDQLLSLSAVLKEQTLHDIGEVSVRAPMSGTIIERLVNPGAGIDIGKPMFTVADTSTLWVMANVPESQIGQIYIGMQARVKTTATNLPEVVGTVTYIDTRMNLQTRTLRVRVEIPNPKQQLKVGMFAEVSFLAKSSAAQAAINIPDTAIQRIGERTVVFIASNLGEGKFTVKDVQTGSETDGQVEIISGLSPGAYVVNKGAFILKSKLLKAQYAEEE